MARAIATRPAVLLLDDVFSAIDKTTKISMQGKLFGRKGILREQGTTVIHVTQDRKQARGPSLCHLLTLCRTIHRSCRYDSSSRQCGKSPAVAAYG